jgi:hypothetical protein
MSRRFVEKTPGSMHLTIFDVQKTSVGNGDPMGGFPSKGEMTRNDARVAETLLSARPIYS